MSSKVVDLQAKAEKLGVKCTVIMDGKAVASNDFIAIMGKDDGDVTLTYNTDALTLGLGIELLTEAYKKCLRKCDEYERGLIVAILGDSFAMGLPYIPAEVPEDDE